MAKQQPRKTESLPAPPPAHDPQLAHLTLAAVLGRRLAALGLLSKDIVQRTKDHPDLVMVSKAQVSKLLGGQQTTAEGPTFRAIAEVLGMDNRTLWFSSGVSRGAITAEDLRAGGCVCLDQDWTLVVPVAGHELTADEADSRRRAANAAVSRRLTEDVDLPAFPPPCG